VCQAEDYLELKASVEVGIMVTLTLSQFQTAFQMNEGVIVCDLSVYMCPPCIHVE